MCKHTSKKGASTPYDRYVFTALQLQRYRRFGDVGLVVCSSTRLEDVPAADTFSVEDMLAVLFHYTSCCDENINRLLLQMTMKFLWRFTLRLNSSKVHYSDASLKATRILK